MTVKSYTSSLPLIILTNAVILLKKLPPAHYGLLANAKFRVCEVVSLCLVPVVFRSAVYEMKCFI